MRPASALLVRLSAIGDVVHTLPAAAALNAAGVRVGWLCEPAARSLLVDNPAVARVFAAPPARRFRSRDARATLRELRAERYEVALDLQGLWKSAAWARLAGARRVIGFERAARREPASSLLLRERRALPAGLPHVIDKNLALLAAVDVEAVGSRAFPLPPTREQARRVESGLAELGLGGRPLALLLPGGGWASKLWPAERYGELARGLRERGLEPLVVYGPGEEALCERVLQASAGAARRSFPTTLLEYVELARRARLVVAADTGPLHLACAIAAPVVALFGPTDPLRNGPFSPSDVVVRRVPACAPCHRRECATHAGVMDGIATAEVLAAADERLSRIEPLA